MKASRINQFSVENSMEENGRAKGPFKILKFKSPIKNKA